MKLSRFAFWLLGAFVMGYVARVAEDKIRFERNRAALEQYYQTVFPVGGDFEKLAVSRNWKSTDWAEVSVRHEYNVGISNFPSDHLFLSVQVDNNKRVKKVRVFKAVIL